MAVNSVSTMLRAPWLRFAAHTLLTIPSVQALNLRTAVPRVGPSVTNGKLAPGRVNAWTEWGTLRDVVVGDAHSACFPPKSASFMPSINEEGGSYLLSDGGTEVVESSTTGADLRRELGEDGWPTGEKSQAVIDAANFQLDNLARVLRERGVNVRRPTDGGTAPVDWKLPIRTPFFESSNQYCATCPRDVVATIGPIVIEAAMSRRDRHFEVTQLRTLIRDLWRTDKQMLWKAAPRPSLSDASFDASWWERSPVERYEAMHKYAPLRVTLCVRFRICVHAACITYAL